VSPTPTRRAAPVRAIHGIAARVAKRTAPPQPEREVVLLLAANPIQAKYWAQDWVAAGNGRSPMDVHVMGHSRHGFYGMRPRRNVRVVELPGAWRSTRNGHLKAEARMRGFVVEPAAVAYPEVP